MNKVQVSLEKRASASYDIYIGYDILDRIGLFIAKDHGSRRSVILTDANVGAIYGDVLASTLKGMGLTVDSVVFPAGEGVKNMATVLDLINRLLELKVDRHTLLIALGGGVVGDITGFVASIFMRSLPYVQIPTSLMAQVDSSIGGKTAVDLPAGKNLIGSFHQPQSVFIDLKFLETLPEREFISGLAEIVKYGIIEGPAFFQHLEENSGGIKKRDIKTLHRIIEDSCRIKKSLVEIDEHDRGVRRILNLGHTIGHALEAESGYAMSHGEAVAIGIRAEMEISRRLYRLPGTDQDRVAGLMDSFGLPKRIPEEISTGGLLNCLARDKKKEGNTVHFVLIKKIGMPFINGSVPETVLRDTIEGLRK